MTMRSITVETCLGTPVTIEPDETLVVVQDNRNPPMFIVALKPVQENQDALDSGFIIPIRVFSSKEEARRYFIHLKDQRRAEV